MQDLIHYSSCGDGMRPCRLFSYYQLQKQKRNVICRGFPFPNYYFPSREKIQLESLYTFLRTFFFGHFLYQKWKNAM